MNVTARRHQALPVPVRRALRKLGQDIRDARRRRRIPVAIMAQRASISRVTLHKIEQGQPGVAMSAYATVLFVLGMADRLAELADPGTTLSVWRWRRSIFRSASAGRETKGPARTAGAAGQEMMERHVFIYVDLRRTPHMVGRLWARMRKSRESVTFEIRQGMACPCRPLRARAGP